jgi:signal transduction histidine kinase
MNKSDSPYVADWFVISLRWLVILGVTISLAAAGRLFAWQNALLLLITIWNISLTWLAGLNRRLPNHRQISLAIDILVTSSFFFAQGGLSGPAGWALILPLISGALYFDLRGALLTSLGMIAVQGLDLFFHGMNWVVFIVSAGATFALGVFLGYISQQMIVQLRLMRQQQIEAREKQQRVENDRLRTIFNLTSTLIATLNYKRVLDAALDLSVNALHIEDHTSEEATPRDDRLVSAVLLFKNEELLVGSARRFTQADLRASFPAKQGILGRAIEEGDLILTDTVIGDPELGRIISLHSCKSIFCFPLRTGFNIYGVMLFGHPEANFFTKDRCDILGIIGQQSTIAIQNARLYQDLADEKERMAEAQEEARKKLARDLHDGPTQSVAAMAMRVNLARRMVDRDPKAAVDELERIEDLARRTTKEIRHMLFTLRPLVLESQGLIAALEQMAEKMKETFAQNVIIQMDEKLTDDLEMGKKGVIFYIAEEAVNNARKHAQAAHIWVRLSRLQREPEVAVLEIADDGVGFDVEAVNKSYDKRGSLGMVNLRERSELVNGLLHIDSAPGKGTRIRVFIPLSEEASDKLHHARIQA